MRILSGKGRKIGWILQTLVIGVLFSSLVFCLAGCTSSENASLEEQEVIGMDMTYFDGQMDRSIHGGVFLEQGTPMSFTASTQTLSEVISPKWRIEPEDAAQIMQEQANGNSSQILVKADAPAQFELIAYAGTQQVVAKVQVHVTREQFDALVEQASALPEEKTRKKLLSEAQKLEETGEEMTQLYYELQQVCQ